MCETDSGKIHVFVSPIYSDIFQARKVYFIPKYQRPSSWDRKQIEDLWNDLLFALEQNRIMLHMINVKND